MNNKTLYIISVTLSAILIFYNNAFAGISVTPDRHIVSVVEGEQKAVMYHIHNTGDSGIDIVIEPKSWAGPKDLYKWLSLTSDSIYVEAGESTPLVVNISAPEGSEGEMVAMLFLCYREDRDSQLNIRNGVPLYVINEGTERYGLDIQDFGISYGRKGYLYELGFVIDIKNTGNVHIVPDVYVVIKNSDGRTINNLSLKRPNIVLRDKGQTYRLGWREPGLRDGIYKATVILDYEDKIQAETKEIEFQVSGSSIEKIESINEGD